MKKMEGITIDTQRLDRINKGTNFLNIGERVERKKFYVRVLLKTSQNLKEKEEKIEVETNFPKESSHYGGYEIEEFLKELKEFVACPLANIRLPVKSQIGSYELSDLKSNLRIQKV